MLVRRGSVIPPAHSSTGLQPPRLHAREPRHWPLNPVQKAHAHTHVNWARKGRSFRMPRDMTGTGRYPPQPKYPPFAFYSCARLGDPEQLAKIMATDPYFVTQDNGAGAPLHFAVTYRQLDMVHHLLNNGSEVNQRDPQGFTPLHRAAYLAHYDGYLEMYEYLLSRGGDPSIKTEDYDPYLNPGCKKPVEVAATDEVRKRLLDLEKKYAKTKKNREPHPDIGDWWTIYDYGLESVKKWENDYKHPYPEDLKRQRDKEERRRRKEERRKRRAAGVSGSPGPSLKETNTPVAILFPGQGSQAVGMLKDTKDIPEVRNMLDKAKEILGYDLLSLCLEGPKPKLDDTIHSQPALFVAGLAAVERLKKENPRVFEQCSATAGLSLGEYTALVFAGALKFEDGLRIVKIRAESMAAAAKKGRKHGMLSVVGLTDSDVHAICEEVRARNTDAVCQLANYLFPQGRVISGHVDALDEAQKLAVERGALKAQKLAVSGAFHTSLMNPAKENLIKALEGVEFAEPRMVVYSNVTAEPFSSAAEIPELLARQLVEPVKWENVLSRLIQSGKKELFELGPGAQIKAMVKRVDVGVWKGFKNVHA